MSSKFRDFMREVEAEARREGPRAVAEIQAFDAHYRLAGELLALRKARGLTQRQLARKTGVNQSEISRIEGGRANPTLSTVAVIAGALGAEFTVRARPRALVEKRTAGTSGRRWTRARATVRMASTMAAGTP